jgi:hypothetical protein
MPHCYFQLTTLTCVVRWINGLTPSRFRPFVVGQFEDFALLRRFGETGAVMFAVPSVLEKLFRRERKFRVVGRADAVRNRFLCNLCGAKAETSRCGGDLRNCPT